MKRDQKSRARFLKSPPGKLPGNHIKTNSSDYEYREHTKSDAQGSTGVLHSLRYTTGRSVPQ